MSFDTEFDDSYLGFLAGIFAGHVSFHGNSPLQTTINPALLTQPSRVVGPSERNIVPSHDVRYPEMGNAPQETLRYHPPAWHPRCPFFEVNNNFTPPHTGAMRSRRQRCRGVRVDNATSTLCQWQPQGSPICGQEITGPSVPQHLAAHGIHNMGRDCIAHCCWSGCDVEIRRQGMTRHFREVHLGLKRKS